MLSHLGPDPKVNIFLVLPTCFTTDPCRKKHCFLYPLDLPYPASILLNCVPYANHPAAFFRSFAAWLIEKVAGDRIFAQVLRNACAKPMKKYMELCQERNEYNKMVYDQACSWLDAWPSYLYQFRSGTSTSWIV